MAIRHKPGSGFADLEMEVRLADNSVEWRPVDTILRKPIRWAGDHPLMTYTPELREGEVFVPVNGDLPYVVEGPAEPEPAYEPPQITLFVCGSDDEEMRRG